MAYGQKNYSQIQGINGKYRISQIGCFLTSFCNLLERFGMPVDPPTLNNIFIQRGIYIDVDDGIRDDLGWQSVTAYNGQIVTTVKSGGVTERNSIVRLAASNSFGTHFCLVDSIRPDGVYIVDSWDGQVKHHNVYGPITGWAVYTYNKPQPVTPIGGKEVANAEQVKAIYRAVLMREGDPGGIANYTGRDANSIVAEMLNSQERKSLVARYASLEKALADTKAALANEQAKPPKEVIKTVEKIVEKPVEVIKEVPAPVDEKQVVTNVLVRFWNSLFKKG